jgi:hypothetical protein
LIPFVLSAVLALCDKMPVLCLSVVVLLALRGILGILKHYIVFLDNDNKLFNPESKIDFGS